jgi:carboxypeptidase family protein
MNKLRNTIAVRVAFALTLTGMLQAASAQAQTASAGSQVRGSVKDAIGIPIAEARVMLQDARDMMWITLSDAQGRYAIERVPGGPYTLTVASPGFSDFTVPVVVPGSQALSMPVTLKIAFTESIEVRQTLSDPHRNPSTVILSSRDVALLPAEETLFLERLAQLAGATRADDVALYVDGFREYQRIPLRDTIDVIRINSNPYSAEYSGRSAKRIEITTKPGADVYHGSARLQIRNSRLNARAPMEPEQSPMTYRNTNGYLQGPLSKGNAGFLLYGGLWERDELVAVHSTIVDAASFGIRTFSDSFASPLRQTSVLGKLDFKVFNQRMNATLAQNTGRHSNRGLESGFNLPEYAYDTTTTEQIGRLWWSTIGKRSLNDVRMQFSRNGMTSAARTNGPAIVVLDAFSGGGNQDAASDRTSMGVQLADTFTLQIGQHLLKAGAQFDSARRSSIDRAGFGGTFTFGARVETDASGALVAVSPIESYRRALLGFPGYGPSQFSIVRGNPNLNLAQWNAGVYLLDDWTISRFLSLSWGVRQESQSNVGGLAVAPRAYLSWVPDEGGKSAVRVGAGVFNTPVAPDVIFETYRRDGAHQEQLIVQNPGFFPAVPSSIAGSVQPVVFTRAADLSMPRTFRTSVSYERQLPHQLWAVAEYARDRGSNLLRTRVIPGATRVYQLESTGRSSEHALQLSLRGHVGRSTFYTNYTLARRLGDTDGAFTMLSDLTSAAAEYGSLATDRRHEFTAGATIVLPRDLYITPSVVFSSGRPFDITTGRDSNGDGLFIDRPAIAQPGQAGAIDTVYGWLNPSPHAGDALVPRNYGREPRQGSFNLSVSKMFRKRVGVTLDIDNVLNVSRLGGSSGVLTSPTFSLPNTSLNGRRFELGARYDF